MHDGNGIELFCCFAFWIYGKNILREKLDRAD